MVKGKDKQSGSQPKHKPTQKEREAEFDKLALLLFEYWHKTKATSLQK